MKTNIDIDLHHLTRVEGHGNIVVKVEDGKVKQARWDVVETPRFIEVMLKGKHYTSAAIITSRICGICSIGHCLASLRASEHALGVEIPEAAAKLRLLAKHGETLQSHYLHVLFLAAPDFLGLTSVLPLVELKPDVVAIAARLKNLANRICDVVAGRTTHPVALQVGGVAVMPDRKVLAGLREELLKSIDDIKAIAAIVKTFDIPDFERETEFVSLKGEKSYPWIGGNLLSTDGVEKPEHEYKAMTNEWVDDNNTTKWCKLSRESMAVGALARMNNNFRFLRPEAQEVSREFGLQPVNHNPFMNNVAQLVESLHCTLESVWVIDDLLAQDPGPTMATVEPRAGKGVGAVEVPRGILYHDYEYNEEGRIVRANCVIPTTQNNANIHNDIGALVAKLVAEGTAKDRIELLCSMLVRAYDPCISCSVH